MASPADEILYETEDQVAVITINRYEEARNAISIPVGVRRLALRHRCPPEQMCHRQELQSSQRPTSRPARDAVRHFFC